MIAIYLIDVNNKLPPIEVKHFQLHVAGEFVLSQERRVEQLREFQHPDEVLERDHEEALYWMRKTGLFTTREQEEACWRLSKPVQPSSDYFVRDRRQDLRQ